MPCHKNNVILSKKVFLSKTSKIAHTKLDVAASGANLV
jgi:hypothetical protein